MPVARRGDHPIPCAAIGARHRASEWVAVASRPCRIFASFVWFCRLAQAQSPILSSPNLIRPTRRQRTRRTQRMMIASRPHRRIIPFVNLRKSAPLVNHTQVARRTSNCAVAVAFRSSGSMMRMHPTSVRHGRPSRTSHRAFRVRQTTSLSEGLFLSVVKGRTHGSATLRMSARFAQGT